MLIYNKLPVYLLLVAPILLRAHNLDYHQTDEDTLPEQHSLLNRISPLTSLAIRGSFSSSYSRRGRESSSSSSSSNSGSRDTFASNLTALINQIPRAPVWNGDPTDQQQIDFNQLHAIMGEPRGSGGAGRGRGLSDLISRPRPRCNRRIRVLNGVTRIRERGSLARFQCSHGFTLIGPTTTVCLRDRWSEPPPICVKGGCRPLQRPQNAELRYSVGGAVAGFYCNGNAKLIGDPVIFCDGINWNGTEPTCYIEPPTTPEPDPEEVWPESVATPGPLNASMGNDDQDSSWDNYVSPSIQETRTVFSDTETSTTPEIVQATSDNEDSATTALNQVNTEPPPPKPVEQTNKEVTEIAHHHKSPEEGMATEKHHEVPAPITTAQPVVHTREMGQSERPPHHPITRIAAPSTTVVPMPPPPTLSNATTPPITTIPLTTIISRSNVATTVSALTTTTPTTPVPTTVQPPPPPIPVTTSPPRRFKVITRRPRTRRPSSTRRSARRPFRRRTTTTTTTTTTLKPRRRKIVTRRPFRIFTTVYPDKSGNEWDSPAAPTSADYAIAIDRAFLPREQVEPIRPIYPDMLNNHEGGHVGHASMIVGIILIVVGLSTFSAGVVFYCWRKNKGIARARPYDMDGRTLSAHDANDDFMWMEQRDSGL